MAERFRISVENAEDFVINYGKQYLPFIEPEDMVALENRLNEIECKYITGEINKEEFSAALEQWWENGGEDMSRELNEKYHAAKGRDSGEK